MTDEEKLRAAAASPMAKGMSAAIETLSLLRDKAGELMDPVKRVCYPPLASMHKHAHKHAVLVSDPIHKICYEPLKGHWERKYKAKYPKHAHKLVAIDLVLAVVIAALIVAGVYSPYFLPSANPNVLTVTVHAPVASVSGESSVATIDYTNFSTTVALPCTILTVDLPPSMAHAGISLHGGALSETELRSCVPPAVAATSIAVPLPPLMPGAKRGATLTGVPYGPIGSVVEIPASISYWTEGSTEPVVTPFHIRLPIGSSAVGVDISVPETILRGATTAVTLSYANTSNRAVPDAAVRFTPPADFVTTGSAPRATSSGLWRLGDLASDARGTIVVYGYLRATPGQASSTSFAADLVANASARTAVTASTTRVNANSLSSGLTLTQDLGSAETRFLRPGDTVTVHLNARNDGDRTFTNGVIQLSVTDSLFVMDGDATPILTWTAEDTPSLASIAPGDTISVTTTLTVRREITPSVMDALGTETASAAFSALLTAVHEEAAGGEQVVIDTPTVDVPVATELRLQAAGIYYTRSGDQIGRGPLPPTVNETTRYRIVLQLDNAQHVIEDAVVEAFLAPGTEWTGRFSVTQGEALDYFPSTRRVTWKIPAVSAFTQERASSPGASFELAFTPTDTDIGTLPALLTGISVTGTDVATGTRVTHHIGDVTTRLPFDYDDARSVVVPN